MPPGDVIKAVVIMLLVILAAYYTAKFLSVRTKALSKSKYMQVKDAISIGRDKTILLIEVAGKYHMLGVSPQSMQLLASFEKKELKEPEEGVSGGQNKTGFADALQSFLQAPATLKKAREEYKEKRDNGEESSNES